MDKTYIAKLVLAEFPKARKVPVYNFIGSLIGGNKSDEVSNVYLDARLYKWDETTIRAILLGIDMYYQSLN